MQRIIIWLALTVLATFLSSPHLFIAWGWEGKSDAIFLYLKYPSPLSYFCLFAGIFNRIGCVYKEKQAQEIRHLVGIRFNNKEKKLIFLSTLHEFWVATSSPPCFLYITDVLVHLLLYITGTKSADTEGKEASQNYVSMHKP